MQFGNKFYRARQAQRRALGLDDPEIRKARQEEKRVKLERGDLFSMLLSAFHMIFLPSVGVLVLLVMAVSLIFGLFSTVSGFLLPILGAVVALWLLIWLLIRLLR